MNIGIFNPIFNDLSLEDACKFLQDNDIKYLEIGCGACPGTAHCDPDVLLNDEAKFNEFKATLDKYGIIPSAFSVQGNPVHPNKDIASADDKALTNAFRMAQKMGVKVVVGFSGCPGEGENATKPNWVTCSWPTDFAEILEWQWEEVLVPYWKKKVEEAKSYGIKKIALEMHPGFCVYNPYTLLKLRDAVGEEIGANFDPSHLIWQGIDPVMAIREMGKQNAIFHFHAKDTKVDHANTSINGVLDTRHYSDEINRSWMFRSVGCGHDVLYWKNIVAELRLAGYEHVLSIEHEDGLMSRAEGLQQAISTLNACVMKDPRLDMFWA